MMHTSSGIIPYIFIFLMEFFYPTSDAKMNNRNRSSFIWVQIHHHSSIHSFHPHVSTSSSSELTLWPLAQWLNSHFLWNHITSETSVSDPSLDGIWIKDTEPNPSFFSSFYTFFLDEPNLSTLQSAHSWISLRLECFMLKKSCDSVRFIKALEA